MSELRFCSADAEELRHVDDFTLVIPTYNRPDHLKRLLKYCVPRFNKILILDSSVEPIAALNQKTVNEFEGKIQYFVFDNKIRPVEKVVAGLEKISTAYFSFCADDDVLFPEGVLLALKTLRENPDIVGVDGIYLSFHADPSAINVGIEYSNCAITADHPLARVFLFLQRYESLFYGVFRTTQLLSIFRHVLDLHSHHYSELFQSVSVLLLGKMLKLPVFYAGRQQCAPAESNRERWQTYYWFAENRIEFIEHYVTYRTSLLKFYKSNTPPPHVSDDTFIQAMDLAHATFFSVNCPPEYFYKLFENKYWPGDRYSGREGDSVLARFKGGFRLRLERRATWFAALVEKGVKAAALPWQLAFLNRNIRKKFGASYECVLATKRISWISGVPEFRRAYEELCVYLDARN